VKRYLTVLRGCSSHSMPFADIGASQGLGAFARFFSVVTVYSYNNQGDRLCVFS
jgi:hypothetical protein